MYMHFDGHGDAAKLARTLHDALALTKTPMGPAPPRRRRRRRSIFPPRDLDRIIGVAGKDRGRRRTSSRSRAPKKSWSTAPRCRRRWEWRSRSTSSRPATAAPPITGDFVLLAIGSESRDPHAARTAESQ